MGTGLVRTRLMGARLMRTGIARIVRVVCAKRPFPAAEIAASALRPIALAVGARRTRRGYRIPVAGTTRRRFSRQKRILRCQRLHVAQAPPNASMMIAALGAPEKSGIADQPASAANLETFCTARGEAALIRARSAIFAASSGSASRPILEYPSSRDSLIQARISAFREQ